MALKRTVVPGVKKGRTRTMGPGMRSPVIGRIKSRNLGGSRRK